MPVVESGLWGRPWLPVSLIRNPGEVELDLEAAVC